MLFVNYSHSFTHVPTDGRTDGQPENSMPQANVLLAEKAEKRRLVNIWYNWAKYIKKLHNAVNNKLCTKLGECAFSFCGPAEWNCLPSELQTITDTSSLKKNLKHIFIIKHSALTNSPCFSLSIVFLPPTISVLFFCSHFFSMFLL